MNDFTCVVAADELDGIGKDNDLPWPRLKADLEHFRRLTTTAPAGKRNAVIMGRRTWDSVPEKYRPLPARLNVVISRGVIDVPAGVLLAGSLDDALTRTTAEATVEAVFVIGGGEIYRLAFAHPACTGVYLTRIGAALECDTFIPDVRDRFVLAETLGTHHGGGLDYRIERWTRPPDLRLPPGT